MENMTLPDLKGADISVIVAERTGVTNVSNNNLTTK